jgi:hypothetical protein
MFILCCRRAWMWTKQTQLWQQSLHMSFRRMLSLCSEPCASCLWSHCLRDNQIQSTLTLLRIVMNIRALHLTNLLLWTFTGCNFIPYSYACKECIINDKLLCPSIWAGIIYCCYEVWVHMLSVRYTLMKGRLLLVVGYLIILFSLTVLL